MNFKKLLHNEQDKISFTKLGGWIMGIAGAVVAVSNDPTISSMPLIATVIPFCKAAIAIGGAITIAGARDALKHKDTP